jgi:lambda family phage portal protein
MHWLDRLTSELAPRWTLRRIRARMATDLVARHYEANAAGRRTQGWVRSTTDANAAQGASLSRVRDAARDLVRNNAYATSALDTIVDDTVGWGIVGVPVKGSRGREAAMQAWTAWAESTACDADGRQDFYGIQKQVMRTVVEAGECLVRRRWRRPEDALPLPMQVQVLEPDFLDMTRDGQRLPNGHLIIQGIEYDLLGRRAAYYLLKEHPGAALVGGTSIGVSSRIDAREVVHVFKPGRPGQARAISWFANVLVRMKDFDEYEDATLMKQKIAACLAVITSDVDAAVPALGERQAGTPEIDALEPGMILNAPPGRSITVVDPPAVNEHAVYAQTQLRAIATGLGVTYEDLTGNYENLPFSAARMSRLRHWARVTGWRWQMLIPQFCDPVWNWAMEAAQVANRITTAPRATWTAPPMQMIEPDKEGLAIARNIRTGITSLSEALRERGYDPDDLLTELAADFERLDELGLVLDSDPRKMSQAGMRGQAEIPTLREQIDGVGVLIRAGFQPEASLAAVGLPAIPHLGVPPVTVQKEDESQPVGVPSNGNGSPAKGGNANG